MLLRLEMIGPCQNIRKSSLFDRLGPILWVCTSVERFWGSFVTEWGQIVTKSVGSTRLRVSVPLDAQFAGRSSG